MSTTLTHSETADTPLALLAKGERQIGAGQYREGSAAVYRAAFTALQEVAARRGWVCETHEDAINITYWLESLEFPATAAEAIRQATEHKNDPLPVYPLLFTTVTCFKIHSATVFRDEISLPVTFWEPEDYAKSLPLVRKFIDLLGGELRVEVEHGP